MTPLRNISEKFLRYFSDTPRDNRPAFIPGLKAGDFCVPIKFLEEADCF
jgi:hypothetical protein